MVLMIIDIHHHSKFQLNFHIFTCFMMDTVVISHGSYNQQ